MMRSECETLQKGSSVLVEQEKKNEPSRKHGATTLQLLLGVNFFVETNRMESFVAVYFIVFKNWEKIWIGYLSLAMNFFMIALQTPAGDILDKSNNKRFILATAVVIASITTTGVVWNDNFWYVLFLKLCEGAAATLFLPGLMSLLLAVTPEENVPETVAYTEVSNKVGSVLFTLGCGIISYFMYPDITSMFYLLGSAGIVASILILLIPSKDIDNKKARSMGEENVAVSYKELLRDSSIRAFAILTFIYHMANAGVVPLVAQYVSLDNERDALTFTSAALLIHYFFHGITAFVIGKIIKKVDLKRLLLVGQLVLPLRCTLLAILVYFDKSPYAILSTQILDGVGAGVYDTAAPLVVSKLVQNSGRFGFTFGFILTCWRMGHGVSLLLAESVAQYASYEVAFVTLGSIGVFSSLILVFAVHVRRSPRVETAEEGDKDENKSSMMKDSLTKKDELTIA